MGIAERKEREKQQMRESILSASMKLFVEHGFEKTSIRKIAQAIEYSPATIYLYFKDKNELFYELHTIAFNRFLEAFQKSGWVEDPFERLRFIGRGYIDFALQHPEQYDLMFIMRSPLEGKEDKEDWHQGKASFQILEDTVKECLEKGLIRPGDYRSISYSLWANVHGICSLAIRNRLVMYEEQDQDLIMESYNFLMASIRA